jgi:DNA polymerase-3 subunit epsilon
MAGDPLARQEVLLLDCQTTGATPASGHVLEIAWARSSAARLWSMRDRGEALEPEAHLVALPGRARPPRRITALTGIDEAAMAAARPAGEVWARLERAARAAGDAAGPVPTVIHFARFEVPFLRALQAAHGRAGAPFPFDPVCTHALARALFPGLPRRGLRALAGYFGHVIPGLKRASSHVAATAVVWAELVRVLASDPGLDDLPSLRRWLVEAAPELAGGRRRPLSYPLPRATRLALPDSPGVYRMLAGGGRVLYVGKAASLQRRVNGYYQKRRHENPERTLELLTQVRGLDVTVTSSALEAAMLESDEIKRLGPPYNRALRGRGGVWFARLDGSAAAPRPDDDHPLGPLPDPGALDALGSIAALGPVEVGDLTTRTCARALGLLVPFEHEHGHDEPFGRQRGVEIDPAVFATGLAALRERHGLGRAPGSLAPLLRAGARLWRDARDADAGEADADGAGPAEGSRGPVWDAERVAAALETVLVRGAHLVRRAHLLCQLSEATVLFGPGAAPPAARRLLVIERGQVVAARDCGDDAPAPAGSRRAWRERQRAFDAATYDRLRVLVTELRRLVLDGTPVLLRLGPGAPCDRAALERRLRWV